MPHPPSLMKELMGGLNEGTGRGRWASSVNGWPGGLKLTLQPHGLLCCSVLAAPNPLHCFGSGDGVSKMLARGGDSGGWQAAGGWLLGDSMGARLEGALLRGRLWRGSASKFGGWGEASLATGKSDRCRSFCQEQSALAGTTAPCVHPISQFHLILCICVGGLDMSSPFCAVRKGTTEVLCCKTKDRQIWT